MNLNRNNHAIALADLVKLAGLQELGVSIPASVHNGWGQTTISGLTTDSRQVEPGDLFIGLPGLKVDGGSFWPQALQQGAVAALVSDAILAEDSDPLQNLLLCVPKSTVAVAAAQLAAAFYQFPSRSLSLIGVTGTNGKTTTTHLIEHLLQASGRKTALLGTLYSRWPGQTTPAAHTTPFAVDLQQTLAAARDAGCERAVLEVSSHSLAQQRVWGCQFEVAVWTNLTQDHLDFHPTMEDYWQAKATLFNPSYLIGRAIVNQDDAGGQKLLDRWTTLRSGHGCEPWTYSLQPPTGDRHPTLWPTEVELGSQATRARLHTPLGDLSILLPLPGAFNLANLMAALGAVLHLGLSAEVIEAALPRFAGVPGRMESVQVPGQDVTVIVDYAHTPDGLENVLRAVRPLVSGQLRCVFGCGGDRDRSKRPLMGRIAAQWSDQVTVTSDNPRTEDPQQILRDILAGVQQSSVAPQVQVDRKTAIVEAILQAQPNDTIVIAGKGHEDYQILGSTKIHFDDREVAREALMLRLGASIP